MKRIALCVVIIVGLTASARGEQVKNISTGINDNPLTKIANNSPDPDFVIASGSAAMSGATPIARSSPLAPPYFTDAASNNSRWLGLNSGIGEEGLNVIPGMYFFETSVDLFGYMASTAQITGLRYGADNKMEEVSVNGVSLWTRPISFGADFFEWHDIGNLGLGSFVSGINTIRFRVLNDGDVPSAMALRLEGSVEATVPEPGCCALATLALFGMQLVRLRRRN
jgi:hypothetical protein